MLRRALIKLGRTQTPASIWHGSRPVNSKALAQLIALTKEGPIQSQPIDSTVTPEYIGSTNRLITIERMNLTVNNEIQHVLRFVLRRPGKWATKDAEQFRSQLQDLIEQLTAELSNFQTHDEFGFEREFPCEIQRTIAEAVTKKWPAYPGHMHKIEEICQGVMYCLRLRLLERIESHERGQGPWGKSPSIDQLPMLWESDGQPDSFE